MTLAVRRATTLDYPVFVRLFPELGVSDPLPTAEQFAAGMLPRVSILEEDGEALGYSFHRVYGRTTHVVHVVVDPRARGRRGGALLLDAIGTEARAAGCARWYLNVKQTNAAAIRLYERCGFSVEAEGWALKTTWAQLATLPGDAAAAVVEPLLAEHDAHLASLYALDPAQLAPLRARPGVILVGLRDPAGGAPHSFAAFDPAFPGIYPVRLARPDLAPVLVDALRPRALLDHVNVFVEGDPRLFERLQAAGAELQHALYRMGAPLG